MSAIVCGSKRSFFEELAASSSPQSASSSPPVSKRLRCSSSTSPVRFSTFSNPPPSLIDQLRVIFPLMDSQLLERVLDECGSDLNAAIKSLHELSLGYVAGNPVSAEESNTKVEKGTAITDEDNASSADQSAQTSVHMDGVNVIGNFRITTNHWNGAEWVELFVREMMSATSIDDARSRAARLLESLEQSISLRAGTEAAHSYPKENVMLKEQIEALLRENTILKRAVAIQHERQKEYDDRNQEVQILMQMVSQYQEQLRTLEVNNYALTMHLQQAQQSKSFPERFNPDVF